jgi:basic membrane protein A and related proteins
VDVRRLHTLPVAVALAILAFGPAGSDARGHGGAQRRPRVVFISEVNGCSSSFTVLVCGAFTSALRRTGIDGRVITPTAREDMVDTLSLLARQRYDLVIGFGSTYFSSVGPVAREYPDVRFVTFDEPRALASSPPVNLSGITFRTGEAAYLAGWLAGKLERRRAGPDIVGVVGGMEIPGVTGFVEGFRAGARRASPGIKVLVDYSNDFVDASKCAALARNQIAKGAGAVFDVAGECGIGALNAAKQGNVWGIGVDTDMSSFGPYILTSVFKRFDVGFLTLLRQLQTDRIPKGKDTKLTLRSGAVGLGKISPKVPAQYRAELDRIRRQIIAGKIRVPDGS